ncbi:MAG: hypothetical protein EBQ87_01045, partial [Planctomycetes bacterium]|nr:hypothetical protein [Planctomycetota bacterium]
NFSGAVSLTNTGTYNVAITDTNVIDFGASALGRGTFTVNAVGITQTGAITQSNGAGAATFNAGNGVITLTNPINNFTGPVKLNSTGATVAISDTDAIDFGSSVLGTGSLTVNAVGITQTGGAITQASLAGAATFNAGAGVITLTNSSNNFTGPVSLTNSGANNVAIVDTNDITIDVTSFGSGTFAVTGSNIKLNSNVSTTNNSQTYTGNVVVNASNSGSPLVLSAGTGAIDITGNLDSATGLNYNLTITSAGDVTISGTTGGTQALFALNITGNDISLGNIGGANVGTIANLSVQASDGLDNGSITLTGTIYNAGGQQFYNARVSNSILLTGGSNGSTVTMTSAGGVETYGTIQLNDRILSLNTSGGSSGFVTNDSKLPSLQVFEGPGSVVLDTGASGPIVINGAIGTSGTPLNSMTITNAANADFFGSIKVNTITITDTTNGGF